MLPLKKWNILNTNKNKSIVDVILENRNLGSEHLEKFKLSERLHDPFLLKDMEKAVARILQAKENGENIGVFGDYDVDGIVSTAMMVKLFNKMNHPVIRFLPSRQKDGYGLKPAGIKQAIKKNIHLLITVDNGISSNDAVDLANQNGIDVIITDHHLQEGELPNAYAVINPNRKDSYYPFKGLCGAGVVFKLFQAIGPKIFPSNDFKNFMLMHLDLVTLATIADVSPVRDENYAILKYGLKSLTQSMRPGLVELKRVAGLLGKEITPTAVGFYLGPRINAAGRLGDADKAVRLLLSETREEAEQLAKKLNMLNSQRQQMQLEYIEQAINSLSENEIKNDKILIVENPVWEPGLIGLISGRLKERFDRPVIAFTVDENGDYVGSGRSIGSFHLTEGLTKFNHLFMNYGGHQKAAGLTISAENYKEFKSVFTQHVNLLLNEEDLIPEILIDTVIAPEHLNESTVRTIREIGPFGEDNPQPVLLMEKMQIKEIIPLSQGKHLKIIVQSGYNNFECVWWGKGELNDVLHFGMEVDIVFEPSFNLWKGIEKLQLIVEDIKPSA